MNIDELIHYLRDIRKEYGNLKVTHEISRDSSLLIDTITVEENIYNETFVCLGTDENCWWDVMEWVY